MELQIEFLNNILREIHKIRKETEKNETSNVIEMIEKYNKNTEYFYLRVYLLEMIPKLHGAIIYNNKICPNVSPQEIFLGCLREEKIYMKYRDIILYQNNRINLSKMITPNINKNIWYLESDLIQNRLLKVFCKMNLINMKNMLKNCPIPNICFYPAKYKIDDPKEFVRLINETTEKKVFDFIPYVRKRSFKNNIINNNAVYYIYDNIELVDNKCFK